MLACSCLYLCLSLPTYEIFSNCLALLEEICKSTSMVELPIFLSHLGQFLNHWTIIQTLRNMNLYKLQLWGGN